MTKYPDDCPQSVTNAWWVPSSETTLHRGRLLRAAIPYIPEVPTELVPEGRKDDRDHERASIILRPFHVRARKPAPLPVAAIPLRKGEVMLAFKAKVRPVVVLGEPPPDISGALGSGGAAWQKAPTVVVAPFNGVDRDGTRAGWPEPFVRRVRRCEYPHLVWDKLPLDGSEESLLRLDQLQVIGRNAATWQPTPWSLSNEALEILDTWVAWFLTGRLDGATVLGTIREGLIAFD